MQINQTNIQDFVVYINLWLAIFYSTYPNINVFDHVMCDILKFEHLPIINNPNCCTESNNNKVINNYCL